MSKRKWTSWIGVQLDIRLTKVHKVTNERCSFVIFTLFFSYVSLSFMPETLLLALVFSRTKADFRGSPLLLSCLLLFRISWCRGGWGRKEEWAAAAKRGKEKRKRQHSPQWPAAHEENESPSANIVGNQRQSSMSSSPALNMILRAPTCAAGLQTIISWRSASVALQIGSSKDENLLPMNVFRHRSS